MKALLVLLLTLFGIAMAIEYNYEDGVVVLTKDNFGPTMSSLKYAMVLFYPPDELAVSPLVNSYPEAAKMITEELPGVKLCKMDAVEYPGYAKSYAGSQFELSLQFFRKGNPKPMSYTAGIRAHEISQWVAETIDESIPLVSSTEELQELLKKNKHVGLYFESNDNELYLKFLGFSTMVNDVAFAKSDSRSLMNKYGASENSFVLFREFGEEYNIYNGELTPEKLDKFVRVYKESAVLHLNAATAKKINTGVMDLVFFLRDKSPESIELQKKFSSFANQNREKLSFVVGVAGETYGDKALTKFGYTKEMLPAVAIYHVSDNLRKYRFDRPINEKNLNIFLSNFFAKNLIPYTMSSEIQAEYDGAIMILVGRTYNDIVLDDTKDVLVEWYSPDCRHCKKFAPKYQELAEKLKGIPDLVIAKIDALSNEVDGIEIWGYPTLKLYPKDRKNSPIDYTGKETVNDMIKFLKERGTVTIDV